MFLYTNRSHRYNKIYNLSSIEVGEIIKWVKSWVSQKKTVLKLYKRYIMQKHLP